MIKRDPSRFMQIGFLALLFLCVLQVGWWITDNLRYTEEITATAHAVASGDLTIDAAVAELESESEGRANRYIWEGAFFLLVLVGGMAILTRTLRHETELRRRQQNFLAAVSHEFKSPLASMQLAAETLIMRSTDPDSKRLGQRILEDCERLLRMVDNLLDTTRIEEGRHELRTETAALDSVIPALVQGFAERAERHGITVSTDITPGLKLETDGASLEAMLRNLVDNALKACIAGDGKRIDVVAGKDGNDVLIEVRDDGLGFPPEESAMMFEKFHRLGDELRRKTPGTGLGLYIVRRLAQQTGGTVGAHSNGPGQGANMTLRWPQTTV